MKKHVEVIVGNIGSVYNGHSERKARKIAAEYSVMSAKGYGRVSGEPVTLLVNGNILVEFQPVRKAGEAWDE